jgi:hypothetical protein
MRFFVDIDKSCKNRLRLVRKYTHFGVFFGVNGKIIWGCRGVCLALGETVVGVSVIPRYNPGSYLHETE